MEVKGKKIGFVFTGAFCTFKKVIPQMKNLKKLGAELVPIMSETAFSTNTRFGSSSEHIKIIEQICKKKIIHKIEDAEPIGPRHLTDIMIVAPASGNTISKLASDIIDTSATCAVKSHLRNDLPVIIAPSTNDGLGANMINIAKLMNRKNYYFVPFRQDNPITKPRSISFDEKYIIMTIEFALDGKQIQPILL